MINIQLKDFVLRAICENIEPERMVGAAFKDFKSVIPVDISFSDLNAILYQFQRFGFISELNATPRSIYLILHVEAIDFLNRGGFSIQEELFQNTYNKLVLEVESLSKDFPEKAERFTTILTNLATIGTFFGLAAKS